MADILLSAGLQKGSLGTSQIEQDLQSIVKRINESPPTVNVGLNVSNAALNKFRSQLTQIVNSIGLSSGAPITVNISGLGEVTTQANNAHDALTNMGKAAKSAHDATASAAAATAKATADAEKEAKTLSRIEAERQRLLRNATSLLTRMQDAERNWTKASTGSTKEQYESIKSYISQVQTLRDQFEHGTIDAATFKSKLDVLDTGFSKARSQIRFAGEATKTMSDQFGSLVSKFGSWLTVSQVVMTAIRHIKQMVNNVIELDTAMTELKKVTNESDTAYNRFLTTAVSRAKELGTALTDVVSATADFARLGYGIEDASKLADAAIIYKNVGDGIEDISQASESIISTMQAFGIEASNAMTIVDKFNEVGNHFAISSTGIGEALLNSASALNAAGSTLDESIALITAANEVIQSPEKVGTAMKTLSMYIRATKVEAEEAGIETEGMANSVSELRTQILALTRNRVDIMESDDDFKSPYKVIKELAAIWNTLKETEQAAITELIGGGVRNANVISALMNNFATAEEVLATSANSAGSALKENEVFLDSIQGKINQFSSAWQALSNTIVDSGLVKHIVDFGTALLNAANWIGKTLGNFGMMEVAVLSLFAAYQKFGKVKSILDGIVKPIKSLVGGAKRRPF